MLRNPGPNVELAAQIQDMVRSDPEGVKRVSCRAPFACTSHDSGSGKTMFSFLMLYRWACEGQRVVVMKHGHESLLFCEDGAFYLEPDQLRTELRKEDVR